GAVGRERQRRHRRRVARQVAGDFLGHEPPDAHLAVVVSDRQQLAVGGEGQGGDPGQLRQDDRRGAGGDVPDGDGVAGGGQGARAEAGWRAPGLKVQSVSRSLSRWRPSGRPSADHWRSSPFSSAVQTVSSSAKASAITSLSVWKRGSPKLRSTFSGGGSWRGG